MSICFSVCMSASVCFRTAAARNFIYISTAWSHKSHAAVVYMLTGQEPHRPYQGLLPIAAFAFSRELYSGNVQYLTLRAPAVDFNEFQYTHVRPQSCFSNLKFWQLKTLVSDACIYMVKHRLFIDYIEHNIFRKTSTMYPSLWPKWVWHINVCVWFRYVCKSRSRVTATF